MINHKVFHTCATVQATLSLEAAGRETERCADRVMGDGSFEMGKGVDNIFSPPSRNRLCWWPLLWHLVLVALRLFPTDLQLGWDQQPRRSAT